MEEAAASEIVRLDLGLLAMPRYAIFIPFPRSTLDTRL